MYSCTVLTIASMTEAAKIPNNAPRVHLPQFFYKSTSYATSVPEPFTDAQEHRTVDAVQTRTSAGETVAQSISFRTSAAQQTDDLVSLLAEPSQVESSKLPKSFKLNFQREKKTQRCAGLVGSRERRTKRSLPAVCITSYQVRGRLNLSGIPGVQLHLRSRPRPLTSVGHYWPGRPLNSIV